MRYIHLQALVNQSIKDLLIDEEDYREEGASPEDYFVSGAEDIREVGLVDLITVEDRHVLPSSFGE